MGSDITKLAANTALQRAEERLKNQTAESGPQSATKTAQLLHQLLVQEIKLETQKEELLHEEALLWERLKELTCLYAIRKDMALKLSIKQFCQRVCAHLITAMQFPEITAVAIKLDGEHFVSANYRAELTHKLQAQITLNGVNHGWLQIFYPENQPFLLPEEQNFLNAVADDLWLWSESKLTDAALENSLQQTRMVQYALDAHAIVVLTDQAGKIIYVNDKFCTISQYAREELLGQDHRLINSGFHPKEFMRDLWATIAQGQIWRGEIKSRTKDGSFYWLDTTIVPLLDATGKPHQYAAIRTDITERKLAEQTLRISEERYMLVEHAVNDGIWDWDMLTDEIYISPRWKMNLGYTDDELPNATSTFFDRVHPDDQIVISEVLRLHLEKKERYAPEIRLRHKDGSYRWMLGRGEAVLDADGRPVRMIGSSTDITERKLMMEKLQALTAHLQSVKEEEWTRISREIHDGLGGMLTVLRMDLEWLAKKVPANPMHERIQSLHQLTGEAIETARKVSQNLRPNVLDNLGLIGAIEWLMRRFEQHLGRKCTLTMNANNLDRLGKQREAEVFRIIQEAFTNIAKHARATLVEISITETGNTITFAIKDNGIGVNEQQLLDPKSFGILGMHERAAQLQGKLTISGLPSQGSTLLLQVPLTRRRNNRRSNKT